MAASDANGSMFEKLNLLLMKELKTILKKELHNENKINLYGVGEYWVAFEKSAYMLEQMTHNDYEPVVLRIKGHPFPLVMHNIHYRKVNDMCRRHVIAERNLEFLQFLTRPIDDNSYSRWYRECVIKTS